MQLSDKHLAYWRRTRLLTIGLLMAWTLVTFGGAWYAIALNEFRFFGFPLGFYLFAQGTLLFYLLLTGIYVLAMRRLDRTFGAAGQR